MATGDLGDGKERAPVVGEAIESAGWEIRLTGGEGGEVVFDPAGDFTSEKGFSFDIERVKGDGELAFGGGDQGNDDGTVAESGRKIADAGKDAGAMGVEGANGAVVSLTAVGVGAAFVSGVSQAAEFIGLDEIGIDFIQEDRWAELVDDPEQDGGAEVFRAEDPRQHGMHDIGRGGSGSACGWCWAHSRAPGKSPGRLNAEWGVRNAEWDRRGQTGVHFRA